MCSSGWKTLSPSLSTSAGRGMSERRTLRRPSAPACTTPCVRASGASALLRTTWSPWAGCCCIVCSAACPGRTATRACPRARRRPGSGGARASPWLRRCSSGITASSALSSSIARPGWPRTCGSARRPALTLRCSWTTTGSWLASAPTAAAPLATTGAVWRPRSRLREAARRPQPLRRPGRGSTWHLEACSVGAQRARRKRGRRSVRCPKTPSSGLRARNALARTVVGGCKWTPCGRRRCRLPFWRATGC
mmetsp:Transcript_18487/g.58758  ORF Transcript_18487/g.58758 Transcript_18487/m.58758 type:complete len:250 (+) Transcript_18487:108-857(+)